MAVTSSSTYQDYWPSYAIDKTLSNIDGEFFHSALGTGVAAWLQLEADCPLEVSHLYFTTRYNLHPLNTSLSINNMNVQAEWT